MSTHAPTEFPCLPAPPLAAVILREGRKATFRNMWDDLPVHRNEPTGRALVCEQAGVDVRTLYRWENECATVTFALADQVLTRLGLFWFDIWIEAGDAAIARRAWEGPVMA